MKTYYWACPNYGSNLDPGEKCDCEKKIAEESANSTAKNIKKVIPTNIINQEVISCQI